MAPGLLGGAYDVAETRFPLRELSEAGGASFVEAAVAGVDPASRRILLDGGGRISYDILSLDLGSSVPPIPRIGEGIASFPVKPLENLLGLRDWLRAWRGTAGPRIAVVGGGPASLEIAAALRGSRPGERARPEVTLVAGSSLLPRFPHRAAVLARGVLAALGVVLVEGVRAPEASDGAVRLADGRRIPVDAVVSATGASPPEVLRRSGLPAGPRGGLPVDRHLRSPHLPEVFAAGDCADLLPLPLDRVGVYAVRQGPLLAANLLAALEGRPLLPFTGTGRYLLILDTGDGRGLLHRSGLVLHGRWLLRLKEVIDRRFIRRYAGGGREAVSPRGGET
jgi:NADH dehydrogenase FAD-containing subunit